jgi:type III secretion protein L
VAKLIKKGTSEVVQSDQLAAPEPELTHIVDARRSNVIDRETYEARAEAGSIRDRATAQAEQILAQANQQSATTLEQARQAAVGIQQAAQAQGYAEGQRTGLAQLAEALAQLAQRTHQVEGQVVPQIAALAIHIARKILGRELEFHPEAVVELVRRALDEKARQRTLVTLRVHPDDAELIRQSRPQLLEVLSRAKELAIREDLNVARYGVVIDTDAGSIDAQLDTQLAVFERVLQTVG